MMLTWILVSLTVITAVSSQKKEQWKKNKKVRGPAVELPEWMDIDFNKIPLDKLAVLNNMTDLTDLPRIFELDFKNAAKLLGPLQTKESDVHSAKNLCLDNQFQCGDGTCIANSLKCDNDPDCRDGSDEHDCSCGPTDFRCGDGSCIPESERCDQTNDCTDGSDELNCRICEPNDFYCDDGACILGHLRCDGEPNCIDGSDELQCDNLKPQACRGSDFTCGDGSCIERNWQCNGYHNCADGSDEVGCTPLASFPELTTQTPELCPPSDWLCDDNTCIAATLKCNGRYDCPDATDELDCGCSISEFQCGNGDCISVTKKCDFQFDCDDGSDEVKCGDGPDSSHCGSSEFKCNSGECITKLVRCDGQPDCLDSSDEDDCPGNPKLEVECAPWEWNCNNGQCIDSSYRCDGDIDCRDRSDELACPRTGFPPPPPPPERPLSQPLLPDEGWCHFIDLNKCKTDSLKKLCPKMCSTLTTVTSEAIDNTAKPIEKNDEIAKFARCSPEMVTVALPVKKKSRYLPSCVRLKRCGGCCNSELLECQPTKVEVISVNVLKISKCKRRGSSVQCHRRHGTSGRVMSMSQKNHVDCTCQCKEQEKNCNPLLHNYKKDACACVCKNEAKQRKCEKKHSSLHYWDKNTCSCVCKEVKECSTGELLSQDTCRCVPAVGGA